MNLVHRVLLMFFVWLLTSCGAFRHPDAGQPVQSTTTQQAQSNMKTVEVPNSKQNLDDHDGKALDLNAISQEQKEALLLGSWQLYFPTPNENWGHRFKADHDYRYVDFSTEAKELRYWYTDGKWRLNGNNIEIQITSYVMMDRDAKPGPLGFQFPLDSKPIQKFVTDKAWYQLGSLESIREGIVYSGEKFPMRISLNPLLFEKLRSEQAQYFKFPNN